VLVLSATVLVLVIENSLKWSSVLSAHDLPLTEAKLVPLSEHDNEQEHEHEGGALRARARNRGSLKRSNVRSAHDLPMTETKLVRVIRAR
jgi:hypothetical protein